MNYVPLPNKQCYNEQVWALVREIPRGRVATYGQITKSLPQPEGISEEEYRVSASRWVGQAMAACPDDVPWHRVVNSQGKISHQSGAANQMQRLEKEGVLFSKGKLDLKEYQWRPSGRNDEPELEPKPEQGSLF